MTASMRMAEEMQTLRGGVSWLGLILGGEEKEMGGLQGAEEEDAKQSESAA